MSDKNFLYFLLLLLAGVLGIMTSSRTHHNHPRLIRQQRRSLLRRLKIPGSPSEQMRQTTLFNPKDNCPRYPSRPTTEICTKLPCSSEADCQKSHESCCFNGCIFTCSPPTFYPPLFDWKTLATSEMRLAGVRLKDVDYEFESGEDLITSNRGQPHLGEVCSTTVDDDGTPPLLCPHGFICHVENPGDPDLGVPDSGRCMPILEEALSDYVTVANVVDKVSDV
ncbi:WAP four-disulfide core domain protein 1-like [Clavelina lepadiformis]|uniref:WAP four-disulfide core domain protein 1-like n=1 Tax=Clavelina lepadiformis TaxID=159417 RepID=UPI004042EC14